MEGLWPALLTYDPTSQKATDLAAKSSLGGTLRTIQAQVSIYSKFSLGGPKISIYYKSSLKGTMRTFQPKLSIYFKPSLGGALWTVKPTIYIYSKPSQGEATTQSTHTCVGSKMEMQKHSYIAEPAHTSKMTLTKEMEKKKEETSIDQNQTEELQRLGLALGIFMEGLRCDDTRPEGSHVSSMDGHMVKG